MLDHSSIEEQGKNSPRDYLTFIQQEPAEGALLDAVGQLCSSGHCPAERGGYRLGWALAVHLEKWFSSFFWRSSLLYWPSNYLLLCICMLFFGVQDKVLTSVVDLFNHHGGVRWSSGSQNIMGRSCQVIILLVYLLPEFIPPLFWKEEEKIPYFQCWMMGNSLFFSS